MWRSVATELRTAHIFTHLVNFCWSLFKWCLLLTLLGAIAVSGYLYFRLDDEIRRQVEVRFANHYRNFVVKVGSARFDQQRGIAIGNLSLTPRTTDGSTPEPVVSVDEMYLSGNIRLEQLVTNQMQIDDVIIRHANLRMVRQADGGWNTTALLPLPHFSEQSPRVTIDDATASVTYVDKPGAKPWLLQGVNLKLLPLVTSADPPGTPPRFHIEGNANGPPARELSIAGEFGAADGALDVSVTANGLDITPELLANLPSSATARLEGASVAGQANVTMHLSRMNSTIPLAWSAKFAVSHGRFTYTSLPDAISDISLNGQADPQRLVIEKLQAKCGSANLALAMTRFGWTANATLAMSARVNGFVLSEGLQTTLPESYARIWQRFRPIGPVDATVGLTFDGANWKPTVTATCHGISLTDMEKFPYVVEQTTGQLTYHPGESGSPDQLKLDLTGIGGGKPIKIDAVLTHIAPAEPQLETLGTGVAADDPAAVPGAHAAGFRGVRYARAGHAAGGHPLGFVEVSGSDIPLHQQILDAIPPKARELVTALHAQGAIDFRFRAEWKDLTQANADTTLDIPLKDCRVQYDPFSIPLQHVQGVVKGVKSENWRWTLDGVEARGSSDAMVVKCRGGVVPLDSGCEADLTFDATNVPLDDILKSALPPGGKQAWDELQPQGSINFTAHATREANDLAPNIEVTMRPYIVPPAVRDANDVAPNNAATIEPRASTVSIEPRRFKLRLSELQGVATYKRGQVAWSGVIGHHDRSIYSVESGAWQLTPDGGWRCDFNNMNVDRLAATRELVVALPPGAQGVVEKLQPSGSISLCNGNLSIVKSPQSEALATAWDVNLECQQAALQGVMPLQGMNGGVHLVGRSDGVTAATAGELAFDSISWNNVQLTNLHGPIWCDSVRCLFGEAASQQQNQPPRRITADAYGGSLATNVELVHGANPSYNIDLHLGGANLARLANERFGGANNLNGTLSGKLVVSGTGNSLQTLRGGGELHVVDANIYELPQFVAMLKVLKNRLPDTTAFNRCDVIFGIQGEHVQFEHLNLLGDAVNFYGKGGADFSRRLNLEFYTLLGPADLPIPLWNTIAGHVSQQGLQVKVVGTPDDLKFERQPFPAINDMLKQLQTGIQDGAATITPSSATRPTRPAAR